MNGSASTLLEVRALRRGFAGRVVLESVDITVPRGAVVSLLGRSGSGKSVFLKCVTGLLAPDAGTIRFEGEPLEKRGAARTRFRRRAGYLFQGNALLDSLTAQENVALPLAQTTTLAQAEIARRSRRSLERLGLAGFEDHFPVQLSGGMQKRVALARALVAEPELLLFDEPTAGLDPLGRNAVFAMIARQRREFGFTAVIVTHDVAEALEISDRVALLDDGRIHFSGTPEEFKRSSNAIVAAMRDSHRALVEEVARINRDEPGTRGIS